ncbi:uncharacterized protein PODANS_7_860 [Podospora anserina S mat+]|uniref:Podospora anserina S mat+ genomic DNA chromosome 7, supercontig 3 n=1 Tax=Podospora anserina (strain S / ATCC MYA-4624 / DSM 980 / FGSC 10383) TaxID=515849 RepID=B2AP04_PODAN|nr:uncharacterized protein PODANS_7_860 [Podospora anserina S mat+]CAP65709.1 unnamed protein product [Podospora anserina S mat+]CDP32769.1 Putative protein of unknown function [Podospora anserina S mat+]
MYTFNHPSLWVLGITTAATATLAPQHYTSWEEVIWDFSLASVPVLVGLWLKPSPGTFAAGMVLAYWFTSIFTTSWLFRYYVFSGIVWSCYSSFHKYESLTLEDVPPTFGGWLQLVFWNFLAGWNNILEPPKVKQDELPYRGRLFGLPQREGDRPKTSRWLPARQLSQKGPPSAFYKLNDMVKKLQARSSRDLRVKMSFLEAGIRGLFRDIGDRTAGTVNTRDEWGGEIAHIHAADGSLHVNLHPEDVSTVLQAGWGQRHPLAGGNDSKIFRFWFHGVMEKRLPVPVGWTLVYAPRTSEEEDVVEEIMIAAIWYATQGNVYAIGGDEERRVRRWNARPEEFKREERWWDWLWRLVPAPPERGWKCECCRNCSRGCAGNKVEAQITSPQRSKEKGEQKKEPAADPMSPDSASNPDAGRSRLNVHFSVPETLPVISDPGIEGHRAKGRMYPLPESPKPDENKTKSDPGRATIGSKGLEDNWTWSSDVF